MDREQPATLYDFPALYDRMVCPGPCEIFYGELARRARGPVLELACGTGRLTVPLASECSPLVGLDASAAMLAAARAKAQACGASIKFVHGDMRRFELGRRFAVIILSCNSMAHLTATEDLIAALRCVARHLAADGLFAFDVINPDVRRLARSSFETARLDVGPNPSSAVPVEEVACYDPVRQVRAVRLRGVGPETAFPQIAPLELRLFFPQELPLLLRAAGLELVNQYGDFARNPLTADSLNQICLARRCPTQARTKRVSPPSAARRAGATITSGPAGQISG